MDKQLQDLVHDNAKQIAVIHRDISTIKDNHLAHIEKDLDGIRAFTDKLDTRIWFLIATTAIGAVATVFGVLFR